MNTNSIFFFFLLFVWFEGMYVIEEGQIAVMKREVESDRDDNGNYIKVADIYVGAIVGEMALLTEEPRNAALKSGKEGAVCTFISHALFSEIQYITGKRLFYSFFFFFFFFFSSFFFFLS